MRKWGPFVLVGVALVVLLVWSQCSGPARGFSSATEAELRAIAGETLPDLHLITSVGFPTVDRTALEPAVLALLDTTAETPPTAEDHERLKAAVLTSREPLGPGFADWVSVCIAVVRAEIALGDVDVATSAFSTCMQETQRALSSAKTVEEWEAAQIARLRFLDAATTLAIDKEQALASLLAGQHRESLGQVLQLRFLDVVVPKVAAASSSDRLSRVVAQELAPDAGDDVTELVAALLRGHTRTFNPQLTVKAGAESVRQLRAALLEPWPEARAVLGHVNDAQSLWADFLGMLQSDEDTAVAQVTALKARVDRLENPVGLALLHNERTSWSGLVQSAYVGDAREAAFAAWLTGSATAQDPISGGPMRVGTDGEARSASDGKDDGYPFIQAFVGG
jgi:hypothetical protein